MVAAYDFNHTSPFFHHYYEKQAGGSLPVFRGSTRQRGYGLGNIFSKVFSGLLPLVKSVAKTAGKQLISTGADIANDVIDGESFSKSALGNLSSGGKQLFSTLTNRIRGGKRGGVKRRHPSKSSQVKRKRRRVTKDIFK